MMENMNYIYNKTLVIGVGLLGGSIASAFKKHKISKKVLGISRSDTAFRASDAGIIDKAYGLKELHNILPDCDLIVIALPIIKTVDIIPEIFDKASSGSIITDVGSTKKSIMDTAETIDKDEVYFIGGHPIAGSHLTGFEAGSADLFTRKPYVIMGCSNVPEEEVLKFSSAVSKTGAIPITIDPDLHDKVAAGISHLPHAISISLMNTIGKLNSDEPAFFDISGKSFQELTRIAGSDYSIWNDIFSTNKKCVTEFIDIYISELLKFKEQINNSELKKTFELSNYHRNELIKKMR